MFNNTEFKKLSNVFIASGTVSTTAQRLALDLSCEQQQSTDNMHKHSGRFLVRSWPKADVL